MSNLQLIQVTPALENVYYQLAQAYEGEFSRLTRRKPLADGRFMHDTQLGGDIQGYLYYVNDRPCGLSAIEHRPGEHEIREFYVVPACRGARMGQRFAHALFDLHHGVWISKQITGADEAVRFWRRTIDEYTHGAFEEAQVTDPYWGPVNQFRFRRI
ncbi:GNAT family N-acetyltransferase [Ferrimonas balearica]|uniref:GNAT family N-acetyltransferase n=1 Tax=Ferrimonas balearica TaxID=44012 RepID=UPI001C993991|nr:hypothetical protein [Ferrimonas balearica]MBY5920241.1 hypothetical protein [Ferrimonas balearica]MBY5997074.1 hypothetical protein [Ferrimonas balearica]